MMATFLIELEREGHTLGEIIFETIGKVSNAVGEIKEISIPGDPGLKSLLNLHFTTNPEAIAITGGKTPTEVGEYGEGIGAVLELLAQEQDFEYDPKQIPSPRVHGDIR